MWRLVNPVQHYGWGSTDDIPGVLGVAPDGNPQAEMWFGAHPSAPSIAIEVVSTYTPGQSCDLGAVPLDRVVSARTQDVLGSDVTRTFGPRLPFLTKLLSAARPLSLQVHPDAEQARQRYDVEIESGVLPESRNYPDASHKPELLVALAPTVALAGFRRPVDAVVTVAALGAGSLDEVVASLRGPGTPAQQMAAAFEAVLGLSPEAVTAATDLLVAQVQDLSWESGDPSQGIAVNLAADYPDDPGVIASMLLNPVRLDPGAGLFVPARMVHCYVSGFGIEVMAASDNVLRAGLTSKRVDVPELLSLVDTTPGPAQVVRPEVTWSGQGLTAQRYATPAPDFELTVVDVHTPVPTVLPGPDGPRTVVCLDGTATITGVSASCGLGAGEAVLLGDSDGPLRLSGQARLAVVRVAPPHRR
ncbi:mannose-6-phosphate isomerase, class I [Sanguibacter sp. Leaf3]|uniref:mannose-6-phosphate isomerase, class I n=1 Tax=Sanguibacter sp. Leaf3 TaxID=1736209 RepID=UPI0006FAC86A|nr:mannose-6-phosphate isomerase, class I [Sanguibacter sp. Leaf3]KQT96789.1 hypothetical protein ASG53_17300 [Sanguibacter sp. Leaf3]